MESREQVLGEGTSGEVNTQDLRNLVEHNDYANAGFKSNQNRLGDEVCDEAELQDRSKGTSIAPTSSVGVGAGRGQQRCRISIGERLLPGPAAVRMARVVVVLTLSGRDVPSTA